MTLPSTIPVMSHVFYGEAGYVESMSKSADHAFSIGNIRAGLSFLKAGAVFKPEYAIQAIDAYFDFFAHNRMVEISEETIMDLLLWVKENGHLTEQFILETARCVLRNLLTVRLHVSFLDFLKKENPELVKSAFNAVVVAETIGYFNR